MTEDHRHETLEQKIEEFGRKLEEIGKKLGGDIEQHFEHRHHHRCGNGSGIFWGLVFVGAGFIWLGNKVNWFDLDLPFWPLALIAMGLYMVFQSRK